MQCVDPKLFWKMLAIGATTEILVILVVYEFYIGEVRTYRASSSENYRDKFLWHNG